MIRWRSRSRENDITYLTNLAEAHPAGLPAIAPGTGAAPLGSFLIRAMKAFFTPMRAFAASKAMLFSILTIVLLAGKLTAVYAAGSLIASISMSDPTLGQIIVLAGTVLCLGFFNLKALQFNGRARVESSQVLLRILESPHVSNDVKLQALAKMSE